MTDSQKIDVLNQRLKRIETNSYISLAIVVVGFLGIVSISTLISKAKTVFKK